ncbi:hypothetical protein ACIQ9P_26060 [Kitasatospora sp. NPDC094019]|uniref:hypothetical protein n=1 Tax=Kitasatospora sp. NPDC094019 TaxID=3364091 RepID=UPI003806A78D
MVAPRFTPDQAVAELDRHGWTPLEEYPGSQKKLWLMRCREGGHTLRRSLQRVVEGYGCKPCIFPLADPAYREKIVRAAGFVPLVPVPRLSATPWPCRCETCGNEIEVLPERIQNGHGCTWCSGRRSPEELEREMVRRGFRPTVPWPGQVARPWPSICLKCLKAVMPILSNLRQRPDQSGCPHCSKVAPITPELAVQRMEERGATPLEPFPGRDVPWLMRCHTCERPSKRRYKAVMRKNGCRFCDKQGFDWAGPAGVYVMSNAHREAGKVGIASLRPRRSRLSVMRPDGWRQYRSLSCASGTEAYEIEQKVLDTLRDLGVPQFLRQDELPQNGATETFALADMSVEEVWMLVLRTASEPGV